MQIEKGMGISFSLDDFGLCRVTTVRRSKRLEMSHCHNKKTKKNCLTFLSHTFRAVRTKLLIRIMTVATLVNG